MAAAFPLFLLAIWGLRIPIEQRCVACAWLLVLLVTEALKTARLNLLHCDGQAARYALWILADATLKPALILAFLQVQPGRTALGLLACHALGSALSLAATHADPAIRHLARDQRPGAPPTPPPAPWVRGHLTFLLPLVGVGLTGWITGLSDRYLVNIFLGAESAGLYAGMYALFSAPFLILGAAFTLAIRPRLLALQAEGRSRARNRWLRKGLTALGLGALGLALLLHTLREPLVTLLLRPSYLQALPAAPGILLGSAILALGTGLEQAFYVTRRTHLVLAKQALGSLVAVLIVLWAAPHLGLAGVGWACSLYASMELLWGLVLYYWSQER
jgi:O-antigen/teichoic acid export membrane protein